MTEIIWLTGKAGRGRYALVDDEDFPAMDLISWYLANGYAVSSDYPEPGVVNQIKMHRLVLGLDVGDPLQGDHINGDRLDNRRINLRLVTNAQNAQNKGNMSGRASKYRGVTFYKKLSKWRARVAVSGVTHYLGFFTTELEAAVVASEFRRKHLPFSNEERILA